MVVMPSGSFMMGSPESEKGHMSREAPQHRVGIPRSIAVGKFEVTVDQYSAFVRDTGHDAESECYVWSAGQKEWDSVAGKSFRDPGFPQTGSHPAACLNWGDAKAYVSWLSSKTGKSYRLLSEAEWEYAARGGTTTRFHFGDRVEELCDYANGADKDAYIAWKNKSCSDGVGDMTAQVGRYKANNFGLHDMHGNVVEWVEDCWNSNHTGALSDGSTRNSGDCSRRVLRGGSWSHPPDLLRSAFRGGYDKTFRSVNFGFRVARTLAP